MYKLLLSIVFSFFVFITNAQPPACTTTLLSGSEGIRIVSNGQVVCVPANSTWSGSFLIRNGGHVVICQRNFNGSVTAEPGGTLWDSPDLNYIGSLGIIHGTRNSNAENCPSCSAPSSGTLTTPSAICSGNSSGINGSAVSGVSYQWQRENTLNSNNWVNIGGNSQNLAAGTIGNLTTTTRFRRRTSTCNPVQTSDWVTVTITVNALPSNPLVAVNGSTCGTGTVNLSVTGAAAGETIDWYADATGGSVLAGGSATANYTTPLNNTSTTYYAELRNSTTGCVSAGRIPVIANIHEIPSNNLIAINGTRCGTGTVNLSVTGASAGETIDWYGGATGGSILTAGVATSNYTTPSINTTTTYYAEVRNSTSSCVSATRIPVNASISQYITNTTITGNNLCSGESTILTANSNVDNNVPNNYAWYRTSVNPANLIVENTNNTVSVNQSGTYFVVVSNSLNTACRDTNNIPFVFTVSQTPTNTNITGNNNLCSGESTILTANSNVDNNVSNNYAWYRTSVNPGNLIAQNTSNTLSVNQAGNYYVIVTNGANNNCKDTVNNPFTVVANFNNSNTTIHSTNNFLKGSTAIFNVVAPSNNINYIWQSDFGQGFQSLRNYGNYNGVNTTNLSIANIHLSEHKQPVRVIASSGNCTDTSNVVIINILDTCVNSINTYDTLLTTVTDTLVINAQITNVNIPTQINTLKVFPNPASSHIYIDYGNFNLMNGYTLSIYNSFGQVVFTSLINQQTSYIDLSTWTGKGVYYIKLIDTQHNIIETRKLLIN